MRDIVRVLTIPAGEDTDADGRGYGEDWPLISIGENGDGASVFLTTDRLHASEVADLDDILSVDALARLLCDAVNEAARVRAEKYRNLRRGSFWSVRAAEHEAAESARRKRESALMDAIHAAHPDLCWANIVLYVTSDPSATVEDAADNVNEHADCRDILEPGSACYCGRWARNDDGSFHDASTDPPREPATDGDPPF